MGFFTRLFARRSSSTGSSGENVDSSMKDESTARGSVRSSSGSRNSPKAKSKHKRRHSKSHATSSSPPIVEIIKPVNQNVKTAKALMDLFNRKDLTAENTEELFACKEKHCFMFEDGMRMTPSQMVGVILRTRESFPDFAFKYESIEIEASNKVTVDGVRTSGTHTGTPFSFRPGVPEIPTTGIHCENDEERLWLEMDKDGKIKNLRIIAMGDKSGPAGFYEQIGGTVRPP